MAESRRSNGIGSPSRLCQFRFEESDSMKENFRYDGVEKHDRRKPMLKVDILVHRRPDLSHEQFVEHWRDVHAQLFSSQPVVKQHVRRYVQSRTIPNPPNTVRLADYDGIARFGLMT